MSNKDKVQRSKFLPEEYKEIYKKDFEELMEQEHKESDKRINSLVDVIKRSGKTIVISE